MQPLAAPRPVELEYVPSLHGKAAEAPSAQYDPAGHVSHAVLPLSSWYLPVSHLSQDPWPVNGCTVPALHSVSAVEPVEQ